MSQRKIIHIDMDAFYASVELREQPHLKGLPVVVAWEGARSVICAASYEARQFGLHSAMSVATAKRLCPQAVYVPPHFDLYRQVSAQIHAVFRRYTDLIEPLSLDEAYLDVTHNFKNIPYASEVAKEIRAAIFEETGLTASAGIAPNKFLAKIASDWRKPNGQFVLPPHKVMAFLETLPLGKIPGVGQGLRGAKQGVDIGQDGRVGQGTGDDAEIVGFQLEGYAFGFDVFSLDLPPQVFGKVGQVSACLFERQVFGQGDFGGDLEAFAFGFDGALVRTARQIIEAVAVASEMV